MKKISAWMCVVIVALASSACAPDKASEEKVVPKEKIPEREAPRGVADYKIGMSFSDFMKLLGVDKPRKCEYPGDIYDFDNWTTGCRDIRNNGVVMQTKNSVGAMEFLTIATDLNKAIGSGGTFGFVNDKLVAMEIKQPTVDVDVLEKKYGASTHVDKRKNEVCQNNMGGKFENIEGRAYWSWSDSIVQADLIQHDFNIDMLYGKCGNNMIKSFSYRIFEKSFQSAMVDELKKKKDDAIKDKTNSTVY